MQLLNSKGETIILEAQPFANGGEGQVHKIAFPIRDKDKCVKIYFKTKRGPERENRIHFMLQNKPMELRSATHVVCWPLDYVRNDTEIMGFVMPLANEKSISLNLLCLPEVNGTLENNFWNHKYNRNTLEGFVSRLKLCSNVALAIHKICSVGYYVFGDLKPQNIRVTHEGIVYLLDTDSIQISDTDRLLFRAGAITPDYAPPEIRISPLSNTWDRFSLAIIFYQILLGIHPFASIPADEIGEFTTLHHNISQGLFPNSTNSDNKRKIKSAAALHKDFSKVPPSLRLLFLKTFEDGLHKPVLRTSIEEWGDMFFKEAMKYKGPVNSKSVPTRPAPQGSTIPPSNHRPIKTLQSATKSISIWAIVGWILILLTILMFAVVLIPGLDIEFIQFIKNI